MSYPHGEDVLGIVAFTGGNVIQLCGSHFIDPDVIRLSAFVIFPGSEFAEHTVHGQVLPVR